MKPPNTDVCVSEDNLTEQMKLIIQLAKDKENLQPPVGLLTTEDRQTWSKLRNIMLKSKFILCLQVKNQLANSIIFFLLN